VISIIIPIYKSEKFLERAVESIINQSFTNLELILVNDGSPDNSKNICLRYTRLDKRVFYLEQKNRGAAHAMKKGVEHANGEYIMFLDGDDWLDSNALKVAFNHVNTSNADIAFWNAIKEFSEESREIEPFLEKDKLFRGTDLNWLKRRSFGLVDAELKDITKFDQISSGWGKIYKRTLFEKDPYCLVNKNDKGNFDTELVCRLFHLSSSIQYINKHFNHYRLANENSITKNHGSSLFYKYKQMYDNLLRFIYDNKLEKDYRQALNNRIAVSIVNCLLSITSRKNNDSLQLKYQAVKSILYDKLYKSSISQFQFKNVNLSHRYFFYSCQRRLTVLVFMCGYLLRFLKMFR